jgi:maleylpyruvate isomerase
MIDPIDALPIVRAAQHHVLLLLERLDAEASRAPSLLPGWSRAHLVTHLARNADAQRGMLEGALRGEVVQMYPGGAEQRQRDIDAGANRSVDELVDDYRTSAERLERTWDLMDHEAWARSVHARSGIKPATSTIRVRWQELELHSVDLGLDRSVEDIDPRLIAVLLPDLVVGLPSRLSEHPPTIIVEHPLLEGGAATVLGSPDELRTVSGSPAAVLSWLLGRPFDRSQLQVDGSASTPPALAAWM